MEYSWQFDPLEPNKPVELTCDGIVIATTTLKNAQELSAKLNSQAELYEALQKIFNYTQCLEHDHPIIMPPINEIIKQAIIRADGK